MDVDTSSKTLQAPGATLLLLKKLWPDAAFTEDSTTAVTMAITRSVYLQQDVLCDFIESDPDDAFRAISELVGTGRVTELQLQLERAKTAWTRATNERRKELEAMRGVLDALAEQLQLEVSVEEPDGLAARWFEWWRRASLFTASKREPPAIGDADAARSLNVAIKELEAARHARERRRDAAAELLAEIKG